LLFLILIAIFTAKSHYAVNIEEIGKIIKERRQGLKVKQLELAELAGVGINTIVAIERGEGNPKLKTVLSVLDTLGLQIDIHL
jgi:y4mF family transcriptional regulator